MATLAEIAAAEEAKKKPALPPSTGGGLTLNVHAKEEPKPPRAPEPFKPVERRLDPRNLGAACCGECLPMDWPEYDPEATWEEARHGTPAETAIVLSQCGRWAWLCLMPSPNHPPKPILLQRWPVAGKLTREAGGLAILNESPSPIFTGNEFAPLNSLPSPPVTALNVGCVTAVP